MYDDPMYGEPKPPKIDEDMENFENQWAVITI
jgi:hypothetical protein